MSESERPPSTRMTEQDLLRRLSSELYWSPELFALLGLVPGDVTPTPECWNERIDPNDAQRGWAEFSRACDERRVVHESDQRVSHADGTSRWIRITNHIAYDEIGKPSRVIGAVLDIENLKQLAERERLARTQAEDANRTKDEFLAMLRRTTSSGLWTTYSTSPESRKGKSRSREKASRWPP